MSINRNRAKLNKAKTNKEYNTLFFIENNPPYWDEGIVFKGRLMSYQVRACKTWKHNRKTRWK